MKFSLSRVIVFSKNVRALAKWYSSVFTMRVREMDPMGGWADLGGGGCRLGLHGGGSKRTRDCGHKFVFGALHLCDGCDPEGNVLQISNRL